MGHLWEHDGDSTWVATALGDDRHRLDNGGVQAVVLRRQSDTPHHWTMLTGDATVRLNGAPLVLGIAVLADRDEIRTADRTVWFSTETRPVVAPFPDSTPRGSCPRCKQPLSPGQAAVRCPSCRLWYHATDDLPCWLYDTKCSTCGQMTALDGPLRWSPEDL
jgi:hypothetical protein